MGGLLRRLYSVMFVAGFMPGKMKDAAHCFFGLLRNGTFDLVGRWLSYEGVIAANEQTFSRNLTPIDTLTHTMQP